MIKKKLILIMGPTATGKTRLSLDLAQKFQLPIVNADSLLFYNELNIGVAKPSINDLNSIPHYLINISSISNPINAKIYRDLAINTLNSLWEKTQHSAVILAGGSGFYIRALLYGMYQSETPKPEVLEKSQLLYETEGIKPFMDLLQSIDPITAQKLHINDHYRIRRAVEHWWSTHTPFSQVSRLQDEKNKTSPFWKEQGWEILPLYTDISKDQHLQFIEKRTKEMLDLGLIEEVKSLLKVFSGNEKPLQSIGYKEVQDYLNGQILTLEILHESIVTSTRQLAKAQRTWFASTDKINLNYPNFLTEAINHCDKFLI